MKGSGAIRYTFLFGKGTARFVIGLCCTMIQQSSWWSDLTTTEFIVLSMFGDAATTGPRGVTVGCGSFAQRLQQSIAGLVRDQVADP
jgi:hypothetical protein